VNEFLYRRADIEDVVNAHLLALERVHAIRFGRYIVSATTPFTGDDLLELRTNADAVVRRRVPRYQEVYARRGWSMFPGIDRVYINERARKDLDWKPRYDFAHIIGLLHSGEDPRSSLARLVGSKGYHAHAFADGPYPVE
jgi:UDP-glucose 4-epimerase